MDDLGFVRKFVNGDRQAKEDFLANYSRLIYSAIHAILATAGFDSSSHAEDIFQELFYSLIDDNCRKLRSFKARNGCKLSSWLRQVAVNHTITYLRRIRPTLSFDQQYNDEAGLADILPDKTPGVREFLKNSENLKGLQDCVSKLDIEDKFLIEMNFIHGLGFNHLKGILGVMRGAFDMRKSRIIERLRECFKHKGLVIDF